MEAEVGERTILGRTVNVGCAGGAAGVSPAGFPVTMTAMAPPTNTEFAPTLNVPVIWPVALLTEHVVSAGLIFNTPGNPEVMLHDVSAGAKPKPETLTVVAVALGGPLIGEKPLVGLTVAFGRTVNTAIGASQPEGRPLQPGRASVTVTV